VAVQPGGKPTIGKFILALMDEGDEVLYPNPGYPIYESQIEFHGGKAVPYTFKEGESGFELDMKGLRNSITPKTKLLIYNNYQNPMGCSSSDQEMEAIANLAKENNLIVLSDEAYFDMVFDGKGKSIASLPDMQERTVILYTFSKKYAWTGWRLGCTIGPKEFIELVAKLNVNDESCSNHFIQYGAIEALTGDQSGAEMILSKLKERRDKACEMLNSIEGIKCYMPEAGFYLFPNVTEAIKKQGIDSVEEFRKLCLEKTGVSFCTREHFGRPLDGEPNKYIRLAFSGIEVDQIEEGLTKLKEFLEA
jgi:aspartate/methionine/tyrosine aminotransferase